MSTGPFHPALALMIAAVWLIGFVFSYRLLRRIGISSRASRIVLGTVPPSAAMILTIQILGFVSTASPLRCVVPAIILPSFIAALTAMLLAWHLAAPSDQQATMKSVCSPSATNCSSDRRPPGNRWWLLPAVVLVGTHLVFVIDGISRYPTGSDALNYHLPAAARWVQDGALSLNPADWRLSLAANGELPLMIMLSGGLERLLPVLSFAQGLLAAMAVYELTRRCGGGRRGATCALLLALSVPIVMHHMYVNYVDLFGASMWLASILAVAWAGRAAGRHRTCLWLIAGLAAGLAAGTRLTFVFFAGITAVALAVNAWMVNRSARMRTVTRASVWFSLAAICCCWFWPVRACIVTGNPIFPAGYDHGHWTIGQAAVDDVYGRSSDGEWLASRPLPARLVSAVILPWREYQYGTGYRYSVDGGTGAAFAMMAPLGLILIVPRIIRRASTSSAARRQLIVGGMLLAGLLLHVTIFRTYTRYSLGFVLLAISLSAIWYDRFIAARPRLAGLMLTLALSISGVMAAIEPARALGGRLRSGNWGRAACYEIPDLIDRLPPGTVIANAGGTSNNYALLGKDLTNRVIGTVEWQSWMASTRPLEQLLRDNQVAYLYVRGHLPAANGAAPMYWPADLPLQCVYEDSQPKSLSDNLTTRVFSVVHAEETNHVAAR